ncbi:hypothetical protein K457DRAFT_142315 [Linnemannia elongata AG-77]|uniref:Uncharacterized protein n=1 Tax=Linnemannia elongata AG-77 TaxID=1314771 RepID=A0A197JFI1_9FUNG|nr:hypothetical protein K457DRAFT_142315 [Linnemannia elongata AG-77]
MKGGVGGLKAKNRSFALLLTPRWGGGGHKATKEAEGEKIDVNEREKIVKEGEGGESIDIFQRQKGMKTSLSCLATARSNKNKRKRESD